MELAEFVERIAGSLTERQRAAILDAKGGCVPLKHGYPHIVGGLVEFGLLPPRVRGQEQDSRLTRKGLAVRGYLKENRDG